MINPDSLVVSPVPPPWRAKYQRTVNGLENDTGVGVTGKDRLTTYQLVGMLYSDQTAPDMKKAKARHESKTKFLEAALRVIRAKGYAATTIEEVCEKAGLTKGSFFHHFGSKEELALAAADFWTEGAGALFRSAPYHARADALERLLAYVDFRKALLTRELTDFTCLAGTMVQEVYHTHPAIREACDRSMCGHAETLEPDIAEAMRKYGVAGEWTARSLALYTQAVLQGSFILAKAKGGPTVAGECLDHLRRYIEMLFQQKEVAA